MTVNLGKAVVDFLTAHPEEKFSARQIAEWLVATFPDECNAKKASSQALETDADLLQQLVAEIGSQRPRLQKKHPNLKTTEGRPRKYYFLEKSDSAEVAAVENIGVAAPVGKEEAKIGEHGLYPLLASYLWAEFEVYSKRIDENRLFFWCPGCKASHQIQHGDGPGARWRWNGDAEKPTFSPSVLVRGIRGDMNDAELASYEEAYEKCGYTSAILGDARFATVCHTFITDGRIQFLSDCTHMLAVQAVPMAEFPSNYQI